VSQSPKRLCSLGVVFFVLCLSEVASGVLFSEELNQSSWDAGCTDWPTELVPLEVKTQKTSGYFRVSTRLILKPEAGESPEQLFQSTRELLVDHARYPTWVLPGVNESPVGDPYFVRVDSLSGSEDAVLGHRYLVGQYRFSILWFERLGVSTLSYRFENSELPRCEAFQKSTTRSALKIVYRMTPRPDLLDLMMGELWLFPVADGSLEVRLRLTIKPSRIPYELLPEKMAREQLQVRGSRLWDNFVDLRRQLYFSSLSRVPKKP
jgi:hypothetical protein